MTVRVWVTISALVLAALAAAFMFRLFAPNPVPEILVRAGHARIAGSREGYCWPQRSVLRCKQDKARTTQEPTPTPIPPQGSLRFVLTYPAQPRDGEITIKKSRTGREVLRRRWTRTLRYELDTGIYVVDVKAEFPGGAFIDYVFAVRVTRAGS